MSALPKKLQEWINIKSSERFDVTDLGDGSSCYYGYVEGAQAMARLLVPLLEESRKCCMYCRDKIENGRPFVCDTHLKIQEVLGE